MGLSRMPRLTSIYYSTITKVTISLLNSGREPTLPHVIHLRAGHLLTYWLEANIRWSWPESAARHCAPQLRRLLEHLPVPRMWLGPFVQDLPDTPRSDAGGCCTGPNDARETVGGTGTTKLSI